LALSLQLPWNVDPFNLVFVNNLFEFHLKKKIRGFLTGGFATPNLDLVSTIVVKIEC
jgi:hypothetical protein